MIQPSPTPVPDHGTGWGLLMLFSFLYGIVALLGAVTVVGLALRYFNKRFPKPLDYLTLLLVLGALGVSTFTGLVAARAQRLDVVALILLIVFLPLTYVMSIRFGAGLDRLTSVRQAALAWSLPFVAGFGVLAFLGTQLSGIPPVVTGLFAVVIVGAGTVISDRRIVGSTVA